MMKTFKSWKKFKKIYISFICLNLIIVLAAGITVAYIFTSSEPVVNTFQPVMPGIDIKEDFTNNIKSNVQIENTGEVSAYIRAKVIVTWQDATGNVFPVAPVLDTDSIEGDYTITYGKAADTADTKYWTEAADGFWYYSEAVASKAFTDFLIISAQPLKVCTDPDYTLHIEILSQSVQSIPDVAVNVWDSDKVDVTGTDGTLTVGTPVQTN